MHDRGQVLLGTVPPLAHLGGDVGGKSGLIQEGARRNEGVQGGRVVPAEPSRRLLNIDHHIREGDLARARQ